MEIIKNDNDFFTSVEKAMDEIDLKWRDYNGLMIVGSHAPENVEEKIQAIRTARVENKPVLGICLGMQLMAVEFARSILGIDDATSEEFGHGTHIVTKLNKLRVGMYNVDSWWATQGESHWHNYALNMSYANDLSKFWDIAVTDGVAEIMRLRGNKFHVGVQFHPEYQSSKNKPHPLLEHFLSVCK